MEGLLDFAMLPTSKAFVSGLFAATRPQVAVFGLPWGFVVGACFSYSHQTLSVAQLFPHLLVQVSHCPVVHFFFTLASDVSQSQCNHTTAAMLFHQQTVSERISLGNVHGTHHSSCVLLKKKPDRAEITDCAPLLLQTEAQLHATFHI